MWQKAKYCSIWYLTRIRFYCTGTVGSPRNTDWSILHVTVQRKLLFFSTHLLVAGAAGRRNCMAAEECARSALCWCQSDATWSCHWLIGVAPICWLATAQSLQPGPILMKITVSIPCRADLELFFWRYDDSIEWHLPPTNHRNRYFILVWF